MGRTDVLITCSKLVQTPSDDGCPACLVATEGLIELVCNHLIQYIAVLTHAVKRPLVYNCLLSA